MSAFFASDNKLNEKKCLMIIFDVSAAFNSKNYLY